MIVLCHLRIRLAYSHIHVASILPAKSELQHSRPGIHLFSRHRRYVFKGCILRSFARLLYEYKHGWRLRRSGPQPRRGRGLPRRIHHTVRPSPELDSAAHNWAAQTDSPEQDDGSVLGTHQRVSHADRRHSFLCQVRARVLPCRALHRSYKSRPFHCLHTAILLSTTTCLA